MTPDEVESGINLLSKKYFRYSSKEVSYLRDTLKQHVNNLIRQKRPSGAHFLLLLRKKDHKLLKSSLLYQSIALYSTETDDTLASIRNSKCKSFDSFHGDKRYVCFRLDYNFNTDYSNCARSEFAIILSFIYFQVITVSYISTWLIFISGLVF